MEEIGAEMHDAMRHFASLPVRDVYRKRWPKIKDLNVKFFAEFGLKEYRKRTLLETANRLPLEAATAAVV